MIYQALIGAWPGQSGADFTERMQAYVIKAAREGKQQTSWTTPDEDYERALTDFVGALLDPARSGEFLGSFATFASRTSLLGALNGLSQLALKALTPGVPDFYQGSEFWDLSLVDPDNRRPVDFRQRQDTLRQPADWQALASNWQTGEIKLALTHALLDLRARYADLFQNGSYEPVQVSGPHARHLIAFSRIFRRQRLVVAVGRHFAPLTDGGRRWPNRIDARLGIERDGVYRDVLAATGQAAIDVPDIGAMLATIPVAVLLAE
jgi:(1->4)-alpha-D-glucan 1-alpha-D-glucosylmutase